MSTPRLKDIISLLARATALEANPVMRSVSRTVGFAEIAALGASMSGALDFAETMPADAVILGADINVTAIVDNAGDSASLTADVGVKSGDTDLFLDGVALNAVAKLTGPAGIHSVGNVGAAFVPTIVLASDVNLDTITKGSFVVTLRYYSPTNAVAA